MRQRFIVLLTVFLLFSCERAQREAPPAVPVKTEVVKSGEFAPALTLMGVVRAARTVPIEVAQSGTLVYARRFASGLQTGARVTRGERIAELRNDQVISSRTQARLQMEASNADFDRAKRSYEQGVVSSAEYNAMKVRAALAREQYEQSTRAASTLTIVVPENGTLIVAKPVAAGVPVAAGTLLAEIASGGAPIIESSVAASDRASLRPGLAATFGDGRARLTEVASVIDASGTARVVASIESGTVPPPGTGVELKVELDHRNDVLTVPEEAIVAASDGPAVFVAAMSAEGFQSFLRVKRVAVETGGRANGRVEITSGLRDGDRVVVSGADALSDDTIVNDAAGAK